MALAALQKKQGVRSNRAVLSTFTNHLARQIREDDAPKVNAALEKLGYPVLTVAPRVGRRQFIDPDRVDRAVRESRDRRDGPDLRSLEPMAGFETFAEAEDHQMFIPAGFTTDDLCLTPRSGKPASAAFMARKQAAAEADLVLTNPRAGPDGLPLPRRGAGHRGRRLDRRLRRGGHAAGGREEPGG